MGLVFIILYFSLGPPVLKLTCMFSSGFKNAVIDKIEENFIFVNALFLMFFWILIIPGYFFVESLKKLISWLRG